MCIHVSRSPLENADFAPMIPILDKDQAGAPEIYYAIKEPTMRPSYCDADLETLDMHAMINPVPPVRRPGEKPGSSWQHKITTIYANKQATNSWIHIKTLSYTCLIFINC